MCEFCMKHGEGSKWYLEAKNYSEDLLSDMRRQKFIEEFFREVDKLGNIAERFEKLDKAPWLLKRFVRWRTAKFLKKNHHGQVVPIEDIEKIFEVTNSIVRVSCLCRHITHAKERRYCYGISMGPNGGKLAELVDMALVVRTDKTARIQETHILAGHLICRLVDHILFQQGIPEE